MTRKVSSFFPCLLYPSTFRYFPISSAPFCMYFPIFDPMQWLESSLPWHWTDSMLHSVHELVCTTLSHYLEFKRKSVRKGCSLHAHAHGESASYLDQFPMLLYNVQLQGNNLPLKVYTESNLVREAVFDHVEPAIRHLEAFPCRKKKMMIGSQVQWQFSSPKH